MAARAWRRGIGTRLHHGCGISVGGDEEVLEIDSDDVCTIV